MRFNRVRANGVYEYQPVMIDKLHVPYGVQSGQLVPGQFVRVVNLPGCPRANTMGHAHIAHVDTGRFLGLVCTNSLIKLSKYCTCKEHTRDTAVNSGYCPVCVASLMRDSD